MTERSSVVVHLFGVLDAGGAEMRTLEVLRRRAGREAHVLVALSGRKGSLEPEFESLGCRCVRWPLSVAFIAWFPRFLRRVRATHVHCHVQLASGYLLTLAAVGGVPRRIAHLWSTGDGREDTWRRKIYRTGGRLLMRWFATDIVAVSRSVAEEVLGPRSPVRVVYAAVDGDRFLPAPNPDGGSADRLGGRLIAVGRLDRDKNPARALTIFSVLRNRRPEATLTFAGRSTGEERRQLEMAAEVLGLAGSVTFLGGRDDVPGLLASSDLLLSTSRREGLPGAVLESAAAGIPAVVSAIPPNEEVSAILPSVLTVPLDAPDTAWSDLIEAALSARRTTLQPQVIRQWFDQSPFALAGTASEYDNLWGTVRCARL